MSKDDASHFMLGKAMLYIILFSIIGLISYLLNWQNWFFFPFLLPLGVWFIPKKKS